MSALASLFPMLLWAQAEAPRVPNWLLWFFVWGEPSFTIPGVTGALLTWTKVLGLFCLLGWVLAWLTAALKEQAGRSRLAVLDIALLAALAVGAAAALLAALSSAGQLAGSLRGVPTFLGTAAGLTVLVWLEARLWSVLRRQGKRGDRITLVLLHLALALGLAIGFVMPDPIRQGMTGLTGWRGALVEGSRLGATYMGFVVLARILTLLIPELLALRGRRLYAIAWQSWTESFRRMWAPWVVLALFGVILAFTSWFLQPSQAAELSRLYVGTLMLLSSILLTFTIVILAPISLPNDIRQQTVYTVVSKPIRRLELIWGRILGYMALVTVLLVLFSGISLIYFNRMVGAAVAEATAQADLLEDQSKNELAVQAREQANQLQSRMAARLPVYGSLIFYDSRGERKRRGIDVGIELPGRSFVEGATPSRAIWRYGAGLRNPYNEHQIIDRSLPLDRFLIPGTIEWVENQIVERQTEAAQAAQRQSAPDLTAGQARELAESISRAEAEVKTLQAQLDSLRKQEQAKLAAGTTREELEADPELHSPRIPVEMIFTVYRTTKGELGEPVYATLTARNPLQPEIAQHIDNFPIREYYTISRTLPARLLVGSRGAMEIEIKCLSPNQYLGMAEGDLYVVASQGTFWANYMRGLLGIWLQALILTAIGVFAGTFLSWPVALLATVFFFVAGNVGFEALQQFALSSELVGGGPFESLIRMLSHDNLVSELAPTPAVVVARTLDSGVMPLMSRLVYLVPNFSALDVSETVASGFAVTWGRLGALALLALAYALPFSIAGYFILRNREVAA